MGSQHYNHALSCGIYDAARKLSWKCVLLFCPQCASHCNPRADPTSYGYEIAIFALLSKTYSLVGRRYNCYY